MPPKEGQMRLIYFVKLLLVKSKHFFSIKINSGLRDYLHVPNSYGHDCNETDSSQMREKLMRREMIAQEKVEDDLTAVRRRLFQYYYNIL